MGKKNKKYYALKSSSNEEIGIYENWEVCQSESDNNPGSKYKSFFSKAEAEAWINGIDLSVELIEKNKKNKICTVFCDGSYDPDINNYSGAYILISSEGQESKQSFSGKKEEYLEHRNVSGEIIAAIKAVDNAIAFEENHVKLYYDYEGIEKWVTGEWNAKTDISKFYSNKMKDYQNYINISFEKVKGHSNNKYNDIVDKMAKDALKGQKIKKTSGNNWVSIKNVNLDNYKSFVSLLPNSLNQSIRFSDTIKDIIDIFEKDDHVTLSYYKSTNSLLIQGNCKKTVFQLVITYANELFDNMNIKDILSKAYDSPIDINIIDRINEIIPNFPSNYPQNLKKLLEQSLINMKYHYRAVDYSFYAFPALRALEGHIKYLLFSNGVILNSDSLDCFEKKGQRHFFKDKLNPIYNETYKWSKIEKCYEYFFINRHPLFHSGTISSNDIATKILTSFDDIGKIIENVFAIIKDSL